MTPLEHAERVLGDINEWCRQHNVRPLSLGNICAADGHGTAVVGFNPQQSYVEPGKAGVICLQMGKFSAGVPTPRYTTTWKVHSWAHGVPPAQIDTVLSVVLVRTPAGTYGVFTRTYRLSPGMEQFECARGFASDVDHRGEAADYPGYLLPSEVWTPRFPDDGVLCSRAAVQEVQQEVLGRDRPRRHYYLDCFAEADGYARMWDGVYLVTADAEDVRELSPAEPDSSQRGLHFVPIAEIPQMLRTHTPSAQVRLAVRTAQDLLCVVQSRYETIAPLWTGKWC